MTHVTFVKGMGITHSTHPSIPFAGTSRWGSSTTTSGRIAHPSAGHSTGGGASLGLPSAAPPSTHLARISISFCFNERSFVKWPYFWSANQGGIFLIVTAALIAFAQGRASL